MSLLKTQNLSKVYRMGDVSITALKDASLEIEKGTFVSVIGPSGSGKSTFLNLIGCLDQPSSGSIEVASQEVSHLDNKASTVVRKFLTLWF